MASFKAKFPVLKELFAKNHRGGGGGSPSGARVKIMPIKYVKYGNKTVYKFDF